MVRQSPARELFYDILPQVRKLKKLSRSEEGGAIIDCLAAAIAAAARCVSDMLARCPYRSIHRVPHIQINLSTNSCPPLLGIPSSPLIISAIIREFRQVEDEVLDRVMFRNAALRVQVGDYARHEYQGG